MTTAFSEASDFDLKSSASRIVEESRSIQQLIRHYEKATRQLQEDVGQHVLKEVDESNRFRSLDTTVAEAELGLIQNSDFVTYSHQRNEADIHTECIFPTSRMRACGGAEESKEDLTKIPWLSKLNSSALSHWSPDSGSSLKAHGDIREVFLGWRKRNEALDILFKRMCKLLFDSPHQAHGDASPTDQKYVCFFNGLPFTPLALANVGDNIDMWKRLISYETNFQTANPVEDGVANIAQSYMNNIIDLSSLSKKEFCEVLWFSYDFETSNTLCPGKGSRNHYNNFTPNLQCDAHDNIILVDPSRLRGSQPFRGFFIKSKLIAVEHIGTPVNTYLLLSPKGDEGMRIANDNVNIMGQVARMFEKIFHSINNEAKDIPASTVITVAFKSDTLLPSSDNSATVSFQTGVVLDVRSITPSLPFCWHLTWAEICALGQLNQGEQAACTNCDTKNVIFKVTDVPASSLLEYDTLSALVFPILNQDMRNNLKVMLQTVSPHHVNHKDFKEDTPILSKYSVVATLGITLVLFGVGLGHLFRGNKGS